MNWAGTLSEAGELKPRHALEEIWAQDDGEDILLGIAQGDDGPSIRRWAVEGLGRYPSDKAKSVVLSSLKDPAMTVRLHAIIAIERWGEKKYLNQIKPLLADESGGIRLNALEALVRNRIALTQAEIGRLEKDEKDYIRKKINQAT